MTPSAFCKGSYALGTACGECNRCLHDPACRFRKQENPPAKKLFLIDASAHLYRALHVKLDEASPDKEFQQVPLVFGRILARLQKDYNPNYMAICFDPEGPTWREQIFPKYKAQRPPCPDVLIEQLPYVRKMIHALGFVIFERTGYEADDIIGTIAAQAEARFPEIQTTIVANDKDMCQLVSAHVNLLQMKPGQPDAIVGFDEVAAKYGIAPRQFADYLALTGDASDGIPGGKGIGPKAALEILKRFDTLEQALANADYAETRTMRAALGDKENLRLAKRLVTIDRNAPIIFDEYALWGTQTHPPCCTACGVTQTYDEWNYNKDCRCGDGTWKTLKPKNITQEAGLF